MMIEKRFILCQDDLGNYEIRYDDKVFHFLWEVAPILNEQDNEIKKLKRMWEMGEKRYSLGEVGWYYTKLIIDDETKHELGNSIVVKTLNEQQATISQLKEENEQLREELNNLKKDETMLYHYYTLARYGGEGV